MWPGNSSQCGSSLDLEEEMLEDLFKFTRHVLYGDHKSSNMAEARAVKWKSMKKKSFIRLPAAILDFRVKLIS